MCTRIRQLRFSVKLCESKQVRIAVVGKRRLHIHRDIFMFLRSRILSLRRIAWILKRLVFGHLPKNPSARAESRGAEVLLRLVRCSASHLPICLCLRAHFGKVHKLSTTLDQTNRDPLHRRLAANRQAANAVPYSKVHCPPCCIAIAELTIRDPARRRLCQGPRSATA